MHYKVYNENRGADNYMTIELIRQLYNESKIWWSKHCLERMNERNISIDDLTRCINEGEIIEDYPDDYPNPSCLVFGLNTAGRYLHAVVGTDGKILYIITVYIPNEQKFEKDGKTRKGRV